MKFFYGVRGHYIDVTLALLSKLVTDSGDLTLPATDIERARLCGDPLPGVVKQLIYVSDNDEVTVYPAGVAVTLKYELNRRDGWRTEGAGLVSVSERVAWLHRHVTLANATMLDEYPEQLMAMSYVRPDATVLELGANIGRNTITIATILNDERRLVTLESDPHTAGQLELTKRLNAAHFQIEASALSHQKLCQRGWVTMPYTDSLPVDFTPVKTVTHQQLMDKYQLKFDTIVADCEGALFYIIRDEPHLLDGVHTVIVENDYALLEQKQYVDLRLTDAGFKAVYTAPLIGVMPPCPELAECFYQVFQRA